MLFWLLIFFAYCLGSIPFGLLLGRMFADVDVREMGSGNIGATNVNRVLGRKLGAATLLCDILKGSLVVLLALFLLHGDIVDSAWVGFAAFIGHCFPIYLQFNGGKGVATMYGILAPLSFYSALVGLVIWMVLFKVSRVSAIGALAAAIVIPIAILYFKQNFALAEIFALITVIVIIRHKENIQRLRQGRENKF